MNNGLRRDGAARAFESCDRPSLRFAVALAIAMVVCTALLMCAGTWLVPAPTREERPQPLQMQLVEIAPPPAPPVSASPPLERPAAPAPVHRATPPVVLREPKRAPQAITSPASIATHSEPPAAPPIPPEQPAASNAPAPSAPSASTASVEARLLSQPLPELPDDLRELAYQAVAVARFTVRVDGTCSVELIKPTSNPRLNQILLEALRNWRFFPAMENGRPVESHRDVRVHFNVQ